MLSYIPNIDIEALKRLCVDDKVMFMSYTEPVKNKRVTVGWWIIWILATALLILFILEPTWFIVPPFVHPVIQN